MAEFTTESDLYLNTGESENNGKCSVDFDYACSLPLQKISSKRNYNKTKYTKFQFEKENRNFSFGNAINTSSDDNQDIKDPFEKCNDSSNDVASQIKDAENKLMSIIQEK